MRIPDLVAQAVGKAIALLLVPVASVAFRLVNSGDGVDYQWEDN